MLLLNRLKIWLMLIHQPIIQTNFWRSRCIGKKFHDTYNTTWIVIIHNNKLLTYKTYSVFQCKQDNLLGHGHRIQGQGGAEIHGVHHLVRATQDLLNYYLVCLFRGMEWIPKCILVSVCAQVWCYCAKSQTIIGSLPTTCYLGCGKSCSGITMLVNFIFNN